MPIGKTEVWVGEPLAFQSRCMGSRQTYTGSGQTLVGPLSGPATGGPRLSAAPGMAEETCRNNLGAGLPAGMPKVHLDARGDHRTGAAGKLGAARGVGRPEV